MRAVVPDELERLRIVAIDQLDFGVSFDGIVEVGEFAVERHGDGALRQRRRDALGDVETAYAAVELTLGAIGKGEGNLGGSGHGLQIAEAILEARFGFWLVGHTFLLKLTPANGRR